VYDIVGDIHGHADELAELLRRMGYRWRDGAYRHPERRLIFVGDLIDRGPQIREVLAQVRSTVEAGVAQTVFGNHEWNALGYHAPDPDAPGDALRCHDAAHVHQHAATIAQVPTAELASHLAWFRTWPFFLELPELRVVHAAWDPVAVAVVEEGRRRHGGIDEDFLIEGYSDETLLYEALDILLKGREMALPPGVSFQDKDGTIRTWARVRWFGAPAEQTIRSYSLPEIDHLPEMALPARTRAEACPYPAGERPVFVGHYWLYDPQPAPLAANVACVDYSVAKGGYLAAYRFDGERPLSAGAFARYPD
jgi:hypothetical protein